MQVWILMRNVWDGRGSSTDVVDEVFRSEIAAERARREKEKAVKDQVDPDRFTIEVRSRWGLRCRPVSVRLL